MSDFLARFPEFGCVEHSQIIGLLAEAPLFVDHKWEELETLGAMLFVAHHLTVRGLGESAEAQAKKNLNGVTSITSGSHRVIYSDQWGATGFEATSYGQRFEALARLIGGSLVSVI